MVTKFEVSINRLRIMQVCSLEKGIYVWAIGIDDSKRFGEPNLLDASMMVDSVDFLERLWQPTAGLARLGRLLMLLRFFEGSQCLCRVFVEGQPECIGFFFHLLIERGLENQLDAFGLHLDKTRIDLVALWYAYVLILRTPGRFRIFWYIAHCDSGYGRFPMLFVGRRFIPLPCREERHCHITIVAENFFLAQSRSPSRSAKSSSAKAS